MNPTQLRARLAHFAGSETFTRHGLARSLLMTEGVLFLAQHAQSHWLVDAIASYLHDPRAWREPFQAWRLDVDAATRQATLTMTDGNLSASIITQEIDYTDFPLGEVTLWLVSSGNHRVLMLPQEY